MTQPSPQTKPQSVPRLGTVIDVTDITPHMRQIRIADPSLRGLVWIPGQHVGLLIGSPDFEPILRVYSVRHFDDQQGIVDLWIVLKELGPGSQWARTVQVGDQVQFAGPRG